MRRVQGFSLLELLLALVLLLLALGLLLAGSVRSASQVENANAQFVATQFAENILADIGYGIPLRSGIQTGIFIDKRYRWVLQVDRLPAAAEASEFSPSLSPNTTYNIELKVHWQKNSIQWTSMRQGASNGEGLQ